MQTDLRANAAKMKQATVAWPTGCCGPVTAGTTTALPADVPNLAMPLTQIGPYDRQWRALASVQHETACSEGCSWQVACVHSRGHSELLM